MQRQATLLRLKEIVVGVFYVSLGIFGLYVFAETMQLILNGSSEETPYNCDLGAGMTSNCENY